jgi:hypothetical protein
MRPIEWRNHVHDWKCSGLSKRAYARLHNLSYSQLLYWTNKPEFADSLSDALMPVNVTADSPTRIGSKPDCLGLVEFPNGSRLHLYDTRVLADLIPLLSSS